MRVEALRAEGLGFMGVELGLKVCRVEGLRFSEGSKLTLTCGRKVYQYYLHLAIQDFGIWGFNVYRFLKPGLWVPKTIQVITAFGTYNLGT